ncbi:MAG: type II toxin-antitoxin system RelE/ParE family toxin [Bacteroidetes bacterium]|nr:type II toxin-antitoxin system RelE/ParE family toxin [Bacteroidota bacterium]NCQ10602.1 type II toxin-antitoxin system RelE/ParE family toxin [Bacteroidota bacterium]
MKVLWTEFAISMLSQIHYYYKLKVDLSTANRIKSEILSSTKQLINYPFSGYEEPHLSHLGLNHRYIIQGYYKIIYLQIENGVLITDVFDIRQNPDSMNTERAK